MSFDFARPVETILSDVVDRLTVAETAPRLSANATSYLSSISAGALIASLSQPYGTGTTYQVVGVAPSQLALSNGQIVAGTGLTGNATRTVMIRAISGDGTRQIAETLSFTETYAAPTPTPGPTPVSNYAFTTATVSHPEGDAGTTQFAYAVARTVVTTGASTIAWTVTGSGGSPANSADFAAMSGTLAFADGETSKTFNVLVTGDSAVEPDETFTVTLSAPSPAGTISVATATGTIVNDDTAPPPPTVSLSAAVSHSEGNSGTTAYLYTVTRSSVGTGAVDVPYTFSPGTTSADDWAGGVYPSGGNCTIASGQLTGVYSFFAQGDTTVEPDETFSTAISAPTGHALGSPSTATGTILNDDSASGGTNSVPATVSTPGNATSVGTVATAVAGTWSGAFTGNWRRDGVPISGATGLTYTFVTADVGTFIDYAETSGSTTVASYGLPVGAGLSVVFDATSRGWTPVAGKGYNNLTLDGNGELRFADVWPELAGAMIGDLTGLKSTSNGAMVNRGGAVTVVFDAAAANFKLSMDASPYPPGPTMSVNYGDANNRYYFDINDTSYAAHRLVAGSRQDNGAIGGLTKGPYALDTIERIGTSAYIQSNGLPRQGFALPQDSIQNNKAAFVFGSGYAAINSALLQAATAPIQVSGHDISNVGKLHITGVTSGFVAAAIQVRIFTDRGNLWQDWTTATGTISGNSFDVTTVSVPGHDAALTNRNARVEVRATNNAATVAFSQTIGGYVAPRATLSGMNVTGVAPYGSERIFANTCYQNAFWQTANSAGPSAFIDTDGNMTSCPAEGMTFRAGRVDTSGVAVRLYWTVISGTPSVSTFATEAGATFGTVTGPTASGNPNEYYLEYTPTFDWNQGGQDFIFKVTGGVIAKMDNREASMPRSQKFSTLAVNRYARYAALRFMDWMNGVYNWHFNSEPWNNRGSSGAEFADRSTVNTYDDQAGDRGICFENIIDFHNAVNDVRVAAGKPLAAIYIVPPIFASADFWDKTMKAFRYGTGLSTGTGLRAGTIMIVAVGGNEQFNSSSSLYHECIPRALYYGRATQADADNAGGSVASQKEFIFAINTNGARVEAALPGEAAAGTVIREVCLQLDYADGKYTHSQLYAYGVDPTAYEAVSYAQYPFDDINPQYNPGGAQNGINPLYTEDVEVLFSRTGPALDNLEIKMANAKAQANAYSKRALGYEGCRSYNASYMTPALTNAFNSDSRMYDIDMRILNAWKNNFGDYVCWYQNSSALAPPPTASFPWSYSQVDTTSTHARAMTDFIAARVAEGNGQ